MLTMHNVPDQSPTDETFDAIIIGSGIGGMTAAGLLAGVAGKRVIVLEKHTEPGGLTHVFRRDGASWDVGLHYVGDMAPGTLSRNLFDYLSGGQLNWNRMPDRFERFIYPGLDMAVPSNPARFESALCEKFPDEATAIRRYFRDVSRAARWASLGIIRPLAPRIADPFLRISRRLSRGPALLTTKSYLEANFRSPQLRAVLGTIWGDYGVPPSRSAFAMHALVVQHYRNGAWFPEGGSGRIARTFETGIERAGGAIRVGQEAVEILTDGGRAVGVRVCDRRGPIPAERIYRAPLVISNAGAAITYERLLPTTGDIGAKTADMRALCARLNTGLSAVTLYLRLSADPRVLGVNGENYWINTDIDHDAVEAESTLAGRPRAVYVSFPSVKSGETRFPTAEIIAHVDGAAFDRWRGLTRGARGADYAEMKQRVGEGMLRLADSVLPGLAALTVHSELSTPLTVEDYTSHPGGRFYGLAATPERYLSPLPGVQTPIEGLLLSGQDAACTGIVGALMGGVGAASQALGPRGFPRIMSAMRAGKRASATVPPTHGEKRLARLTGKSRLTEKLWRIDFELDDGIAGFSPGQFARLRVANYEWRDYSIAGLSGHSVRFLISTQTGGDGSRFVESAVPGDETAIELPLGQFGLTRSDRRQVFVATGSGLAPFLPMFEQLQHEGRLDDAVLLFGCRGAAEDVTSEFTPLPGHLVRCYSREAPPPEGFAGRVTGALQQLALDPDRSDVYVCGASRMVAEVRHLLELGGHRHIHSESF